MWWYLPKCISISRKNLTPFSEAFSLGRAQKFADFCAYFGTKISGGNSGHSSHSGIGAGFASIPDMGESRILGIFGGAGFGPAFGVNLGGRCSPRLTQSSY